MVYIILAMLLYTAAIMFATTASRTANTNLITAVINTVSSIIPLALVVPLLNKQTIQHQKFGVTMAAVAGVFIALYALTIAKGYATNKVAIVVPVVFGGSIFLSAILSYVIFKEKISQMQGIGLLVLGVGLGLIIYSRLTGR